MGNIYVQYAFISVVFVIAVFYVIRLVKDSVKGKKSCAKGCGCENTIEVKK